MPYDGERRAIFCRICGRTDPAPEVCPGCGGAALRWIGAGTERVEEVIGRLFPAIRIARRSAWSGASRCATEASVR